MFQGRVLLHFKLLRQSARFQHSVTSAQSSLPSNLILFGKAKERFVPEEKDVEIQPPGDDVPVVRKCVEKFPVNKRAVKVWVDSFANDDVVYDKAAELNPEIYSVHPRIDLLHEVVTWQKVYREVDYKWARTRAELGRGRKKPWPQKGTGRVRQGSTTPPFWKNGGIAHGPRGPKSLYYDMNPDTLIKGLTIALTVKRIQNDLIIVEDLKLPAVDDSEVANPDSDNEQNKTVSRMHKKKLTEILGKRCMDRNSVLFVYDTKVPENLSMAVEKARGWNVMPLVGLNVLSILKHDKLVMHLDVLDELEKKVIWNMKKYPWLEFPHNFYTDMPINRDNLNRFMEEAK